MQPGTKPKPTKLKLIEGVGKHRINQKEPMPRPVAPECPDFLSDTAKGEWARISGELETIGLLTKIDMAALAGYCDAFGRWVDASLMIQKHGMIIKAPSGYPIQSPYLSIVNTAIKDMKSFLVEFGMTPSSRSRINVEPNPDNPDNL